MTNNEKNLLKLVEKLEGLQKSIPDTIKAAKSLPLEFGELYQITEPGELRIDMQYNVVQYRILRRFLKNDWKFVDKYFHENLGFWFSNFAHKRLEVDLKIGLELSSNEEASCRRIKVGEKTMPIYKMECK
jgi:hypothetical protein